MYVRACLLLLIAVCALSADPVAASPGFEQLGGPRVGLGVEEQDPIQVVHEGRLYLAVVDLQPNRWLLVVNRLTDGGRWERVGTGVNVNAADRASYPALLSTAGGLYIAWTEAPLGARARLMLARMRELPNGTVEWERVGPDPAPESRDAGRMRLVALRGRPALLYRGVHGPVLGVATDRGWQLHGAGMLVPAGAEIRDLAAEGNTLYLTYMREARIPEHRDPHTGYDVPMQTQRRWGLARVTLAEDDTLVGSLPLELPLAVDAQELAMDARAGARPLVAWADDRMIVVAQLNGPTELDPLYRVAVDGRPWRLGVTRLAGGVAVAARNRQGITLYRIQDERGQPLIRTDRAARAGDQLRLIADPTGQPAITYTDERHHAVVLRLSPGS